MALTIPQRAARTEKTAAGRTIPARIPRTGPRSIQPDRTTTCVNLTAALKLSAAAGTFRWYLGKRRTGPDSAAACALAVGYGLMHLGLAGGVTYLVMKRRHAQKLAEAEAKRKLEEEFTERTILTISNTIDAKDEYTNGHSRRVAQYALEIGRMEGLNLEEQRELYYAGLLHDIGKIAIPDSILKGTTRLTDEEFALIKSHTSRGAVMLAQMKNQKLADGAHYHHERYDGKGYPDHLNGEKIPVYGRIIAVGDVVDAMNSKRTYKDSIDMSVVIAELKRCAGTQLDPKFAADMVKILESGFVADAGRDVVFDEK